MSKREHHIYGKTYMKLGPNSYLDWDPDKGGKLCTPDGCTSIPPEGPEPGEKLPPGEPKQIEYRGVEWALNTAYGIAKFWSGNNYSDEFAEAFQRALEKMLAKREDWESRIVSGVYKWLGIKPTVSDVTPVNFGEDIVNEYVRLRNKLGEHNLAQFINDRDAVPFAILFEYEYGWNPLSAKYANINLRG